MLRGPGPDLDKEVARRLGEETREPAAYSTDARAAERLIARLKQSKIFATCENAGKLWYCALSADIGHVRERLATGTGESRPLALCRAVMNLPGEKLRPPLEAPSAQ